MSREQRGEAGHGLSASEAQRWEEVAAEMTAAIVAEQHAEQRAGKAGGVATMPAWVEERVIADGEAMVRAARIAGVREPAVLAPRARRGTRVRSLVTWSGWLAAAAAVVFIVRGGAANDRPEADAPVVGSASVITASAVAAAPSLLRDSLLARDVEALRIAWKATADSAAVGAGGDVVWSATSQTGVMRITGLAPNDRRRAQYQLWIFDATRDRRYPVDGGVFDIEPGATEAFVRIVPRVPVGRAVMFAVTVEVPGGVVVSTRERVALLAEAAL